MFFLWEVVMLIVGPDMQQKHDFLNRYTLAFAANRAAGRTTEMGVELETVLVWRGPRGEFLGYAPNAHEVYDQVLQEYPDMEEFLGLEFTAIQLEVKAGPERCPETLVEQLMASLYKVRGVVSGSWKADDDRFLHVELQEYIAGEMSQDLSPRVPRYATYAQMHPERADVMRRCASGQMHVNCNSWEEALDRMARLRDCAVDLMMQWTHTSRFDGHNTVVCPQGWFPPAIGNIDEYYTYALQRGFVDGHEGDYAAWRLHPKWGTLEVRFPGPAEGPELLRRLRRIRKELAL